MTNRALSAISPIDGRYASLTQPLQLYFCESALIANRLLIEIQYLFHLTSYRLPRKLTPKEAAFLTQLTLPSPHSISRVKSIESDTHHDVKAVEYYLKEQLQSTSLKDLIPFLHIGLTSEDTNNLAYRLALQSAHRQVLYPLLLQLLIGLNRLADQYQALPILARTHGQPAIPTTLGKEFSVFAIRLLHQLEYLENLTLSGKLNGAVGGFHAHTIIDPSINWLQFSQSFVKKLHLQPNLHTTQINPNDDLITLFGHYHLTNSIMIGLCQDIWRYVSDDWLLQRGKDNHVGSSTMPQKTNPIEFENAEGNLILANGFFETFNRKLPISRLQRDLSDSTTYRNLGVALAHSLIAYHHLNAGLNSITPNTHQISIDLNANWNILAEALQTHLRVQGKPDAYELVAKRFKHHTLKQSDWRLLTSELAPKLVSLTPDTYLGLAPEITSQAVKTVGKFLARHSHSRK